MNANDELGTLLPTKSSSSGIKKKPSFYGIRSHLNKFYELSFSPEGSEQSSPPPHNNGATSNGKGGACSSNCLIKSICRLCIFSGSLSILVGICLLIAVFSTPIESPVLTPANSTVERIDMAKFRHNAQLEMLQVVGVSCLLFGSVLLLLSTMIAIIYLLTISCFGNGQNNNGQHGPYVYDSGDY